MESWLERFARANFARSADTAHDLKTPLNIAVLNLELLRMRLRKLNGGEDDPKVIESTRAIEVELRRMGRIFDEFFVLSTPPRGGEPPVMVDLAAIVAEGSASGGYEISSAGTDFRVFGHEARIRQAVKLFLEGAARLAPEQVRRVEMSSDQSTATLTTRAPASEGLELTRLFKFYCTDSDGNPELSLAVARLIAETYGGELIAVGERDTVILRLSFPVGER